MNDTTIPLGGGPDGKSPIFVPAGAQVNYQVYSMHRREDLYGEDAAEFKPERWATMRQGYVALCFFFPSLPPSLPFNFVPNLTRVSSRWHFLPFNGGPRICIGQQFALTEAGYTTIRLLQAFEAIESRDDNSYGEWVSTQQHI